MTEHGEFEGRPAITFLPDGRRVKTVEPFAFIDAASQRWDVPAGATVDGASIPRALWTFVGGPFEGKYRDASIIHDWYCDLRCRPWRAVHLVFYEAMLVSSVPISQAKLLYAGVLLGGPRWSDTVVENVNHNDQIKEKKSERQAENITGCVIGKVGGDSKVVVVASLGKSITVSTVAINNEQVKDLQTIIDRDDPSVESIAEIADSVRADLTNKFPDVETKVVKTDITLVM